MANPPKIRSLKGPSQDFRQKLRERTGIDLWTPDSTARTMSDTLSEAIVTDRNQMVSALEQTQVSSATGKALDALARTHEIARLEPTKAYSDEVEKSVYFYVRSGTFGDLTGGSDIVLPAGTVITPPTYANSEIRYVTKYNYTLLAGENKTYCSVEASSFGSGQNVGPQVLTVNELQSTYPNLLCTNKYAIVNGRNREGDDQLRFRLSTYFRSLVANNYNSLILNGLTVPGVLDIAVVEGYYGMGTAGIFVFGSDGFSSPDLIRQVEVRLAGVSTPGLRTVVSSGVQVSFSFDIDVIVPSQPTSAQRARIVSGIKQSIRRYLSKGSLKRSVSMLELRDIILSDNTDIVSLVNSSNRGVERLFRNVYVSRKYASFAFGAGEEKLSGNSYSLEREEFAALGSVNIDIRVLA
jgi:uncharacterized phage protein gp47/JayE